MSTIYYYNTPLTNESHLSIEQRTGRGCALSIPDRILRWIIIMKGAPFPLVQLTIYLIKNRTTAIRDFIHCCFACIHCLSNEYLKQLMPGTDEFEQMKGIGVLEHFPSAVYIGDVTKVE